MHYQLITYADPATQAVLEDIVYAEGTIWMTQKQISKLYQTDASGISRHIKKIYADDELDTLTTSTDERKLQIMQNTQKAFKKPKKYYNLQVIIAVGFKVNSPQASAFRARANSIVDEYSREGYALDDQRLTTGNTLGGGRNYDSLMDRVRAIRFDERNVYEKIKDLFATATDYNKKSKLAIGFFQTIQNKFHYAIVGMTSPEILMARADANKPALGMQHTTKNNITLSEAKVGKNYLVEEELRKLYLLCEQFFAFAELQYAYERDLTMNDWIKYLDQLLTMNKLEVVGDSGSVSRKGADTYVKKQMKRYQQQRGSLEAYIEGAQYLLEQQ